MFEERLPEYRNEVEVGKSIGDNISNSVRS